MNYGSWFDSGQYGWCWRPTVGLGWQPYYNGYWQWYPGFGYTWVSSDPWGWAPYHYGRWTYLNSYGWAWVPWSQYSGGSYAWYPSQVYWYQYPGYSGYSYVPLAPNEPYIDYRRFDNRHQRNFIPEHLRAGRGIGLTQQGAGARLRPVANARPVKGTSAGGRLPVAVNPQKPRDVSPERPRFKPVLTDVIRNRPVVVDSTAGGTIKDRGPANDGHPKRAAAGDNGVVVVSPSRKPASDETPTMVGERPAPARIGADDRPTVRPKDGRSGSSSTGDAVVASPRTPGVDAGDDSQDRPKPRRVEPVGPPTQSDGGTVDRSGRGERAPRADRAPKAEPKVTQEPRVERVEPRRSDPPANHERSAPPPPRQERQPAPERQAPRVEQRVERSSPPPSQPAPRVERAPDSGGGGKHNKPR